MRISNEDIMKLARRAGAHVGAGVEGMEINAEAMEKLMLELLEHRRVQPAPVQHFLSTKTNPGTIKAIRAGR